MNKLGVYNKRHSASACSSAKRVDRLLKQSWEISPCQATGQALGVDSPTEINKSRYCFLWIKNNKESMGLGVSKVKSKPSGVWVRSLQSSEARGPKGHLSVLYGAVSLRDRHRKSIHFHFCLRTKAPTRVHTTQDRVNSLYYYINSAVKSILTLFSKGGGELGVSVSFLSRKEKNGFVPLL